MSARERERSARHWRSNGLRRYGKPLLLVLSLAVSDAPAADFGLTRLLDIGKDVVTAATGIEENEEIAVGREVAGRLLGAAPLVKDDEAQGYVNRVGRWVASQSERPDLPWNFGILDTDIINAFAAPGGYVLITRGLFEMLENEAQLAGVLGHEIAHVVRRHHITVMRKSAALSAGSKMAQRDSRSQWINSLIGNGAEIFARGLDKSAESEADAMGLVLAARAGYNPYGLVDVLLQLAARSKGDNALALLYKTHPSAEERLVHLGEKLTPRVADLPAGRDPSIQALATNTSVAGARRRTPEADATSNSAAAPATPQSPAAATKGIIDTTNLLRGLLGR